MVGLHQSRHGLARILVKPILTRILVKPILARILVNATIRFGNVCIMR